MQDRGESSEGAATPQPTADCAAWPDLDSDRAKGSDKSPESSTVTPSDTRLARTFADYAWPGQDERSADAAEPQRAAKPAPTAKPEPAAKPEAAPKPEAAGPASACCCCA